MNATILEFIDSTDAIPSMPQIVTRLLEITRDTDYKIADVINLLSTDVGVAGDILKLANSPLFGVSGKVSSLTHATNLLGIKRIRTLVMGRCMVDKVNQAPAPSLDLSYYWRRSLTCGVLAARFAEHALPNFRDEAFMSGLLGDVGIVVLARALPEKYAEIAKTYAPHGTDDFVALEEKGVGTTHPYVSALALERWGLPETMIEGVRHHHDAAFTGDLDKNIEELARVVHGASSISKLLCEAPEEEVIASTCAEAMAMVRLNVGVLENVLGNIEGDIAEFADLLRIDVIPSSVYRIIAKTVSEHLGSIA